MKYINLGILFLFIILIYHSWFLFGLISAGDFWYYYPSMYPNFDIAFFAWNFEKGNGFGMNSVLFQGVLTIFGLPILLLGILLKLPWEIIERIGFFYPFLIIGIFGTYFFHKSIFQKSNLWIITTLVFLFNTYILTVVSGGQMLIAISYALAPVVLYSFIKKIQSDNEISLMQRVRGIIVNGLLFGLAALIDLRIAYVLGIAIIIFYVTHFVLNVTKGKSLILLKRGLFTVVFPMFISVLLNMYWVIQIFFKRGNPLGELGDAYSAVGSVKFFSFARLENSISLLHPNWPENLFGKVYFMRPEFLLFPLLAFSAFLFIKKNKILGKTQEVLIYFGILSIIGAFLGKGANEPFGSIYILLFEYIPGMVMFRDSTKFYLLVALSFSILIPFFLYQLIDLFKKNRPLRLLIPFLFIAFWAITIRQALSSQMAGTLKQTQIPPSYHLFQTFLENDMQFYRTLWVPQVQRFGYFSPNHPPIVAEDFFKIYSYDEFVKKLNLETTKDALRKMSIKYIVVPYDSEGEIFLDDRKYSDEIRTKLILGLSKIKGFHEVKTFDPIGVFEISGFKDHFWVNDGEAVVNHSRVSPVEYNVEIMNAKKDDVLIFSEAFDPMWEARIDNQVFRSNKYELFNSFILPKDGTYKFKVYYKMQDMVNFGITISITTLVISIGTLFLIRKK